MHIHRFDGVFVTLERTVKHGVMIRSDGLMRMQCAFIILVQLLLEFYSTIHIFFILLTLFISTIFLYILESCWVLFTVISPAAVGESEYRVSVCLMEDIM